MNDLALGIMSDTHGNGNLAYAVAARMRDEFGVGEILHLGDNYTDGETLLFAGFPVRTVPGLQCHAFWERDKPNVIVDDFNSVCMAMAHASHLFGVEVSKVQVQLSGHTHVAQVKGVDGVVHHNPGHLKAARDRGQDASFSILRIGTDTIHFAIIEAAGGVRIESAFHIRKDGALRAFTPDK